MAIIVETNLPNIVPSGGGLYTITVKWSGIGSTRVRVETPFNAENTFDCIISNASGYVSSENSLVATVAVGGNPLSQQIGTTIRVVDNITGQVYRSISLTQAGGAETNLYMIDTQSYFPPNKHVTVLRRDVIVGGGYFDVTVHCDYADWVIRTSTLPSWIKVTNPAGYSGQNVTVRVTISASTQRDNREYVIPIYTNSSPSEYAYIHVVQSGNGISILYEPYDIPPSGGDRLISILSPTGTQFTINCYESWVTISPTSGSGDFDVHAIAQANTSSEERYCFIYINSGNFSQTVQYRQEGAVKITVDGVESKQRNVDPGGETFSVNLYSDKTWTAGTMPSWLNVSPLSGNSGNTTINVTAEPNATGSTRVHTIEFTTSDGFGKASLIVTQSSQQLIISSNIPDIVPANGGSYKITVRGTGFSSPWGATKMPNVNWLNISPTFGNGGTTEEVINVTISQNTIEHTRSAQVVILSDLSGFEFGRVNINQAALVIKTITVDGQKEKTITRNSKSGSFNVEISSDDSWAISGLPSWASASPTSSGIGTTSVAIAINVNNSGSERKATISFTTLDGTAVAYLNIAQTAVTFDIISNLEDLLPNTGGIYTITLHETGYAITNVLISPHFNEDDELGVIIYPPSGTVGRDSDLVVNIAIGNNSRSEQIGATLDIIDVNTRAIVGSIRLRQAGGAETNLYMIDNRFPPYNIHTTSMIREVGVDGEAFIVTTHCDYSDWLIRTSVFPSWLSVDPQVGYSGQDVNLQFKVNLSREKNDRNYLVPIYTKSDPSEYAYLLIKQSGHGMYIWNDIPEVIPQEGGTYHIHIVNDKGTSTQVTLNTYEDFIGIDPKSGTGSFTSTITIQPNTIRDQRTGSIIIESPYFSDFINITQAASTSTNITVDGQKDKSIPIGVSGASFDIEIASDDNWVSSGVPDWISGIPSFGVAGSTIASLVIGFNSGDSNRRTVVTFTTSSGTSVAYLTITQAGAAFDIISNIPELVPFSGGEYQIIIRNRVESCAPWVAESSAPWIILDPLSGDGCGGPTGKDDVIAVTIDPYYGDSIRTAKIYIYSGISHIELGTIEVVQDYRSDVPRLNKCIPSSPFYLRWMNRYGGWDCFMFQKRQVYEISQSNIEKYSPYISDYSTVSGTDKLLSKEVAEQVTIGAEQLKSKDFDILCYITKSAFVQWYDKKNERWIDVIVDKTKAQKQTDDGSHMIEFVLLLPTPNLAI